MKLRTLLASLAAVAAVGGCGKETKPSGTVAGRVTHKGKPVEAGTVNFLGSNGSAAMAKIETSGTFKLDGDLDAGDYKVYILPPVPEPVAPGTKPTPLGKFEVPPKYRDPSTSGVSVTVKAGTNDIPVEIEK